MFDFSGKVAIVTGASRGIGRGIAEVLAARGAHVVAGARGDHVNATVESIQQSGGKADAVTVDVTDEASIEAMVSGVLTRHGRVDVLVNNAGIARDQLMLRMKRQDWDEVIGTNLTASFTCVQAVLKPMIKQRGGRIVSISSVVGQMGNAGQANYAASKAGLIGFSKALAREVASRNITVNVVAPGLIDTDMTRAVADRAQADWESLIPLKRLGNVQDVAAAVCFLASDEAAYITGQVLAVNGGMYM
jgi:3-oxoacyl-[acyl-carrier protein] reductase